MTRKLAETLNLPHLDDILKDQGVMPRHSYEETSPEQEEDEQRSAIMQSMERAEKAVAMMDGRDHGEGMDTVFKEALDHARNIADLGYNVDHARAARMFEVAASMYKVALDAKNSKRDAQLKAMQIALNQQKLEMEKQGANEHKTIDAVVVEDRNELIKRYREQAKEEKERTK